MPQTNKADAFSDALKVVSRLELGEQEGLSRIKQEYHKMPVYRERRIYESRATKKAKNQDVISSISEK